jgi:acetoin utilization deacetylase AcuC-like enzyme
MSTGFLWDERYAWHDTGTGSGFMSAGGLVEPEMHGESPATKRRFRNLLDVTGLLERCVQLRPRPATDAELLRLHTPDYVRRIKELSAAGGGDGGELAPFGANGFEVAALAAGGAITATEAVIRGEVDNAYALVRPPGHHAERDLGRGFCIFGNTALAALHAREALGASRVAIVDWDVHHGNGTEHAFYEDPNVLAISLHQDNLYPVDSGAVADTGAGEGAGATLNVPLPPGSGNGAYEAALERVVAPAIRCFRPDIVLVASGFDASMCDPFAVMAVTSPGFARMTRIVLDVAEEVCNGRLVLIHEGGYSSAHVPFCGVAVIEELLGVEQRIEDPFTAVFRAMGYMDLQPHQDEAIRRAEANLNAIPIAAPAS